MANLNVYFDPWSRASLLLTYVTARVGNTLVSVNARLPKSLKDAVRVSLFRNDAKGKSLQVGPFVASYDNLARYETTTFDDTVDEGLQRPFNLNDDLPRPFTDVNTNRIFGHVSLDVAVAEEHDPFSVKLTVNAVDNRQIDTGYALPTRLSGQGAREYLRDLFLTERDDLGWSVYFLGFFFSYTNIGAVYERQRSDYRIAVRINGGNVA